MLCLFVAVAFLGVLLVDVAIDGVPLITPEFITNFPSRLFADQSGIRPALIGTLYLMVLCAAFIVPIGVAAAVYLEEYADNSRWWNRVIEVNIQNLASVPSVVYGILGLAFIVRGPIDIWGLGKGSPTLLAGALTLGLLVLPVVIIVSREAIRAVPPSIREGSLALGATKWQTIWKMVLPGSIAGHRDRRHPRAVAGDRRDRAAHPRRRDRLPAHRPDDRRPVLGAADRDLRLRGRAARGVPDPRRRRDRRAARGPAAHELRRDLPAQPLRAEVVSDMPLLRRTDRRPAHTDDW